MKGVIEELGQTVAVYVVLVIVIMIAFISIILTATSFIEGSLPYSVEITDSNNRPYMMAEVLTHYNIGGKSLAEQCTRAVITNSAANDIETPLKDFMDKYGIDYELVLYGEEELFIIGERKRGFTDASIPFLYKDTIGYLTVSAK